MPDPSLSTVLDQFTATVQKGRLIAIPAVARTKLGLTRRQDNHLLRFSLRKAGRGRWNHDYAKLSFDNEFALPSNILGLGPGDTVEIKIHQVLATRQVPLPHAPAGADLLVAMAKDSQPDDLDLGAQEHDEYLNAEAEKGAVPRRKR